MSGPHCCDEPGDVCKCVTEEDAHAACDCPQGSADCINPDCCEFCHGRWAQYVTHDVTERCRPDCPMRAKA